MLVFCSVASSEAVNENEVAPAPRLKDGLEWQIGYCESKNFVNYPATFNVNGVFHQQRGAGRHCQLK